MKVSQYMTRAMASRDPRYRKVLGKLGYVEKQPAKRVVEEDPRVALRAQAESLGVKVDGRWSADRLTEEIGKATPAKVKPDKGVGDPRESAEVPQRSESKPIGAMTTGQYPRRDMRAEE